MHIEKRKNFQGTAFYGVGGNVGSIEKLCSVVAATAAAKM